MSGAIEVGITSWTEKTLVDSGWYPRGTHTPEGMLRYYASQFPIVENDSMYYAIPPPERAVAWAERTPPGFTMNVKAFATLTEHYTDARRLPVDLREALDVEMRDLRRIYPKDMGTEIVLELATRFQSAIEPLRATGRLGLVLFQYPVWFTASPENEQKLLGAPELLPGCRVAVEFRNSTWMDERHRARTLDLLRDGDLVYTCVDEPQGFPSSIPPVAEVTSDIALVRFHGRSASRWRRPTESASERFRYLYSTDELREWVAPIRKLAEEAEQVHVLMNNCWSDYSVRNARELTTLLDLPEPTLQRHVRSHAAPARV